jgi:large subunit ribosomal protein LP2
MKYIASYLLAMAGGKAAPTADDIKAILESVGIAVDAERLNKLIEKFQGKNVEELIEEGSKKMIIVGGAAAPSQAAAPAAAAEEQKEEEKEEEAAPLDLGDMFDF